MAYELQTQEQQEQAVQSMRTFLQALGLDLQALGMEKTPQRVTAAFTQFFSGLREDPDKEWGHPIQTGTDGLVAVRNIRFHSLCEHHLLPFFGTVHIAYYPQHGKVAGFGHFIRAVTILAERPQLQERLTEEICQSVYRGLQPAGVLVIVKAKQLCMTMLQAAAGDTDIVTAATAGNIVNGNAAYEQAWKLLMEDTTNAL